MADPNVLIIPGRGNSEAAHWQSILESSIPGAIRVEQDWNDNDIEIWSDRIDRAVARLKTPPLVVAHSFGCLATAYAQIVLGTPIGASLFVAPAAPARFGIDRRIFASPLERPGCLIASETDPWLSLEEAISLAQDWGIETINLGAAGHINAASGYGRWPFGETLAKRMRENLAATQAVQRRVPQNRTRARAQLGL